MNGLKYINIEVAVSLILLDNGNSPLKLLLEILKENNVDISKQRLFYYMNQMVEKGLIQKDNGVYRLHDFFINNDYFNQFSNLLVKIFEKELFRVKDVKDITKLQNKIILMNSIILNDFANTE